ncbi:MAG: LysR substrate-binding domain-containing protein, partial [Allorhizobium sp.]
QQYPDIDLQIVATQRLGHHWREDADLAVAFGTASEFGPGATLLMPERVVPVCTPSQSRRLPDVSPVEQGPLIHLEAESIYPWLDWPAYLTRVGLAENDEERPGDLRFNTYALVVQAAMAGQGVALGWLGLVDHLLDANLLVVAGEMVTVPGRGYWLVSGSKSDAVTHLASWLVQEAAITGGNRLAD